MKSAVIVFPGSNCDRDAQVALRQVTGAEPAMVWHKDVALPQGLDLMVLPGGFSYGDYLRSGAMAATSPVGERDPRPCRERGGYVLAICNGFQVLDRTRHPAGRARCATPRSISSAVRSRWLSHQFVFTARLRATREIVVPDRHHDGNYYADAATLDLLEGEGRVAFRYHGNPNGSARDIAGVLSENGRVLGMMPHPERAIGGHEGGSDGLKLFESVMAAA